MVMTVFALPTAEIVPIKIVRDGTISGSDVLTHALRYIYENISCDIINISAGIVCCEDIPALREVCMRIIERGTVIVSAFDNGGAISYPAAFDNVIGIDGDIHNRDINHYEYLSGSNANFCGAKLEQRVPWLDGTKEIVSGNSFIAPHFTAWLLKHMELVPIFVIALNSIRFQKLAHTIQALHA